MSQSTMRVIVWLTVAGMVLATGATLFSILLG